MTMQKNTRSPSIAAVSHALSCQPQQSRKQINHNHCNCIALKFIFKQMIRYKC